MKLTGMRCLSTRGLVLMIKEVTTRTSLFFHINSNFGDFFLKRIGIDNSGGSGFPILIFVKFSRFVLFVLLPPALGFGIVLLLYGFSNFLYRIFIGLLRKLCHSTFDIERTIMGKDHVHVAPCII